jgi:hypothetical protein
MFNNYRKMIAAVMIIKKRPGKSLELDKMITWSGTILFKAKVACGLGCLAFEPG